MDKFLFDTILKTRKGKTTFISHKYVDYIYRLENILNRADHIINMNYFCQPDGNNINKSNDQISHSPNNNINNNKSKRTIRQLIIALLDNNFGENQSFNQTNLHDYDHEHSSKILYQSLSLFTYVIFLDLICYLLNHVI